MTLNKEEILLNELENRVSLLLKRLNEEDLIVKDHSVDFGKLLIISDIQSFIVNQRIKMNKNEG